MSLSKMWLRIPLRKSDDDPTGGETDNLVSDFLLLWLNFRNYFDLFFFLSSLFFLFFLFIYLLFFAF